MDPPNIIILIKGTAEMVPLILGTPHPMPCPGKSFASVRLATKPLNPSEFSFEPNATGTGFRVDDVRFKI